MSETVLVVGAGPVGLTMAAELARYGVAVRIIDKAAAPTDKSKALVLWSRSLELLERAGCVDGFVAAGLQAGGANFIAGRKRIAHVDLTRIPSRYAYGLMLGQSTDATARLLRPAEDLLEPAIRPPLAPGALHLVRPDRYVAMAARRQDLDSVIHALDVLRR